ncbi:MAG: Fe-S cluster assembly ATPase SufC [Patescibacteria group bacterium]
MLEIKDLNVSIEDKEIIKGLSLVVNKGEIHALMGPNGSGKSTLAQTLMGHPKYEVTSGQVLFNGKNLLELDTTDRAKEGLFLAFQYPSEITGVTISNFLRLVYNNKLKAQGEKEFTPIQFRKILKEKMEILKMDEAFAGRYLNEGFSGGEKKRMEILQMFVFEPKLAILDETDSGLDIDALKIVSEGVKAMHVKNNMAILIITHYTRILSHINPDFVHVMKDGKIIREGGHELAEELEKNGYVGLEE